MGSFPKRGAPLVGISSTIDHEDEFEFEFDSGTRGILENAIKDHPK
jgi:hypothetical protein